MSTFDYKSLIAEARKIVGVFDLDDGSDAGSVAAALISRKGNIYTGICVSVRCGIGFCAEHSAIAEMLKQRECEISAIVAVNAKSILPPCGRCRELIAQVSCNNSRTLVILSESRAIPIRELLPHQYKPSQS